MEKQFVQIVRHIFSLFMSHRTFVKCSRTQFDYAMFSLFTQKSIFLLQLLLLFATAADLLFVLFFVLFIQLRFSVRYYSDVNGVFSFPVCNQHQTWKIIFRAAERATHSCVKHTHTHTTHTRQATRSSGKLFCLIHSMLNQTI